MIGILRNITNQLKGKPSTLFLIDGLGALITAFSLFIVLQYFNKYFGVPSLILTYLSVIAACLCIFSTTCFFFLKGNWARFIRGISIANLLYCILTMGLLIVHYPQLTILGTTYFLVEIVVVCGLVYIELNVATAIKNTKPDEQPAR